MFEHFHQEQQQLKQVRCVCCQGVPGEKQPLREPQICTVCVCDLQHRQHLCGIYPQTHAQE